MSDAEIIGEVPPQPELTPEQQANTPPRLLY